MPSDCRLVIYRRHMGLRFYVTEARCECGFRYTANRAPTNGGRNEVISEHAKHMRASRRHNVPDAKEGDDA